MLSTLWQIVTKSSTFKEHESEACCEEVVDGDGDDLALGDGPAVQGILLLTLVQGRQHAHVGTQQRQLKHENVIKPFPPSFLRLRETELS